MVHFFAASLGAVAILATPASSGWKIGALSTLVFVTLVAHAVSRRKSHCGWIDLHQDGTAHIRPGEGKKFQLLLKENAWAIRWLCVLALIEPDSGRHYHYVVCASENAPDEYRRLLKFLNMRTSAVNLQKATR